MRVHPLIVFATEFAINAHEGQARKYTDDPYIIHPLTVARTVSRTGARVEMIAAALLHDVVEDTAFTLADIEHAFGADIAALVEQLTDVSKPGDGNRAARKALDRAHTAKASPDAQTIKLADLLDNMDSITRHDAAFARVYMTEKLLLLSHLTEGDPALFAQAAAVVATYFETQENAQ